MQSTGTNSKPMSSGNVVQPLFRPEVLSARGDTPGEILLLRPLSLSLLCWTAVTLTVLVAAFFFYARYTPVTLIPVTLVDSAIEPSATQKSIAVNIQMSASTGKSFAPGATLVLLCRRCGHQGKTERIRGTILGITQNDIQHLTVSLSVTRADFASLLSEQEKPMTSGWHGNMEAEVPQRPQPLYRWIFTSALLMPGPLLPGRI